MTQETVASPTETTEHPPIYCVLQLRYDGTVSVLATGGCTVPDIQELVGLLAAGRWETGS